MEWLDVFGEILWYGIFITPVISFLVIKKMRMSIIAKVLLGLVIVLILATMFFVISMEIVLRDGLGPT